MDILELLRVHALRHLTILTSSLKISSLPPTEGAWLAILEQ